MYNNKKISVIIAAAGSGTRMGGSINKQYICIAGTPMIARTVQCFQKHGAVDEIVIVTGRDEIRRCKEDIVDSFAFSKVTKIVAGGKERQDSVEYALSAINNQNGYVLVHDGARPFVTEEIISDAIRGALLHGAAAAGVPVKDTIKITGGDRYITSTPDRERLFAIQTPQAFQVGLIREAFRQAGAEGFYGTDETVLVERMNQKVYISKGSYSNIKITTPEDIKMGEALLCDRQEYMGETRSGIGYDVHALVPERKLILGGVEIGHDRGLLGHSDADVLTHAIMDALLGAAGLGDIGRLFPDTDMQYKGISSLLLLSKVKERLEEQQWHIVNIDAVIAAQKPRLMPHINKMVKNIADTLEIETGRVNVKATTTEKLGFEGREEGISAQAICSIQKGMKI